MGYYVHTTESTFTVPAANVAEAFARLKAEESRFLYESADPRTTLAEFLQAVGYEFTDTDDDGNVILGYYGDKDGEQRLVLDRISDLATGYVCWVGEEDEYWRDTYGGPNAVTARGHIVYGISTDEAAELNALDDPWGAICQGLNP